MNLVNRIFPPHFDNDYRGHKLALWLFGVIVFMRLGMSLSTIFNGRKTAISADGIPLDTFTPAGAQTVVSIFALLGLAIFVICLLCILVLVRYRSMVPVMFALLLLQSLGGRLILWFLPFVRTVRMPGFYVNLVLLALMIIGLALSLWHPTMRLSQPLSSGAAGDSA
jgi:hypothetical protein